MDCIDLVRVGMGGVLFECGTEQLVYIKCEEFLYNLKTTSYEDSAQWS